MLKEQLEKIFENANIKGVRIHIDRRHVAFIIQAKNKTEYENRCKFIQVILNQNSINANVLFVARFPESLRKKAYDMIKKKYKEWGYNVKTFPKLNHSLMHWEGVSIGHEISRLLREKEI